MENCFDAFVYVANWGTRRFVLRLPQRLLAHQLLFVYCQGDNIQARSAGEFVGIEFGGDVLRFKPPEVKAIIVAGGTGLRKDGLDGLWIRR